MKGKEKKLQPYPKRIGVGGFEFSKHERKYLEQVTTSSILSYGPLSQEFERRFAAAHGVKHAIVCNSGTSALQVGLLCLKELRGWKENTEVIVPALTFVATLNVVLEAGLKPVLVDVDRKTYNMDPLALNKAVTSHTGCVIPVHLFGQPCQMDAIMSIAKRHHLAVMEDSAETMFARYAGQSVGSFGDIGCFSTYIAHLLVTGTGGILTTQDDEIEPILRSLINHGRDPRYLSAHLESSSRAEDLEEFLKSQFRFLRAGFSYRMTEMEAALGLGQLDQMESFLEKRARHAAFLSAELSCLKDFLQLPEVHDQAEHRFMMYPLVVKDEKYSKWKVMEFLERHNVETREMLPLTNQPVYAGRLDFPATPVSEWVNRAGFYMGCHPYLSEEELAYQVKALKTFFLEGNAS